MRFTSRLVETDKDFLRSLLICVKSFAMNSTLESVQDSCYELELFFKDAMKTVISISDIVVCVVNILFSLVAVFANILIL